MIRELTKDRRRGLSMMEVTVSLMLVTTIMLVSLSASANVMRNRALATEGIEGQRLAGFLIDEISVRAFVDPDGATEIGLDPGESASNRASFDDIDDYQGYSQTTPSFRDGNLIPGFANWVVGVRIVPVHGSGRTLSETTDFLAPMRAIQVTVTSPTGQSRSFQSLVSNVPTDRPEGSSFERLRRVEIGFSADRSIPIVVPLRNTPAPVY